MALCGGGDGVGGGDNFDSSGGGYSGSGDGMQNNEHEVTAITSISALSPVAIARCPSMKDEWSANQSKSAFMPTIKITAIG